MKGSDGAPLQSFRQHRYSTVIGQFPDDSVKMFMVQTAKVRNAKLLDV